MQVCHHLCCLQTSANHPVLLTAKCFLRWCCTLFRELRASNPLRPEDALMLWQNLASAGLSHLALTHAERLEWNPLQPPPESWAPGTETKTERGTTLPMFGQTRLVSNCISACPVILYRGIAGLVLPGYLNLYNTNESLIFLGVLFLVYRGG